MTLLLPKPPPREKKKPQPIRRTSWVKRNAAGASPLPCVRRRRIRDRMPKALGDHREKVKYANELWRRLIYAKEPSGICPRCRARRWVEAAHGWIKGKYEVIRFHTDNGAPLCRVCHRQVDSDHHAKREFWIQYIGRERYDVLELRVKARSKGDVGLEIMSMEFEFAKRGWELPMGRAKRPVP